MKKLLYLSLAVMGIIICPGPVINAQGVSVNSNSAPPDNSAMIDVSSNSKGALIPRMTSAQRDAIANPAEGLTIYNTDCHVFNYNAGTPGSPNWATLNSSNALVASVGIAANPGGPFCAGTSVTFTAIPAAGISSPIYQWQVNGANVGSNNSYYITTGLNNGDVVSCILSTAAPCVAGSPATSNLITAVVSSAPATPGTITGSGTVCQNDTGEVYSISTVDGATSYNWALTGGAVITAGSGSTSITVSFGTASGNISVAAVNACGESAASSTAYSVTTIPATPGTISGAGSVCSNAAGQIYSINPVSGATSYNWTVPPGASITASADTTITVTFGANPAGSISVSATNSCGTGAANTLSISQALICPPYTFSYTGGLQSFTIPSGVTTITIQANGAAGGSSGGLGASIQGSFSVNPGDVLSVLVGGQGGGGCAVGGGGGGSFVVDNTSSTLLVVAGGGGGGGSFNRSGINGSASQNGNTGYDGSDYQQDAGTGGTGGGGGGTSGSQSSAAGGGGYSGNGAGSYNGSITGGKSYLNGGAGGNGYFGMTNGGYGGGGGGDCYWDGGGGGGGYSGGGGGFYNACGGGGGSYNAGSNQVNTSGVQSGNGQVVFTW